MPYTVFRVSSYKVRLITVVILLALIGGNGRIYAQGRSIFNASFEDPDVDNAAPPRAMGDMGVWGAYDQNLIPFWGTTATDGLIEIGKIGAYGVPAQDGDQMAELNANMASNLFFNVCLFPNEDIAWSIWHRGRAGTDEMGVVITEPNGNNLPEIVCTTPNTFWQNFNGTYTNTTGAPGNLTFTFRARSTATGDLTVGNLIDNVTISGLAALVEFDNTTYSDNEDTGGNIPVIRINGDITGTGARIFFGTAGTATAGTDYTLPAFMDIPAGTYFNTPFTIPLSIDDDLVPEADETVDIGLMGTQALGGGLAPLIRNTSCGPNANDAATYTILDADVPLAYANVSVAASPGCNEVRLNVQAETELAGISIEQYVQTGSAAGSWETKLQLPAQNQTTWSHLLPQSSALALYRLRFSTADGSVHYSNVVESINACWENKDVQLYPNPVPQGQGAELHLYASGTTTATLIDATGKVLLATTLPLDNGLERVTLSLPTGQLSAGLYRVLVQQNGRTLALPLVIGQ